MTPRLNFSPAALCVACFSSGRELTLINGQETKQMFSDILDNFEISTYTILLCFECVGRLKSVLRFRRQVQQAHQYWMEYSNHNSQPTSISRLEITITEIFEWKPDQAISNSDPFPPNMCNKKEITLNHGHSLEKSDEELSGDADTLNVNSDSETSISNSKKSKKNHQKHKQKNDFKILHSNPSNVCEVPWVPNTNNPNGTNYDTEKCMIQRYKVENIHNISENTINIKEEPTDAPCNDIKHVVVVTKCEFSDSDEEPLKAKKTRKKKIKKEVKEPKSERPAGVVSGVWVQKKLEQLNVPPGQLEMVVLSWEEVELEMQKSQSNVRYTRHEFRCPSCVVGFNHRFKLDSHMKKHAPEAGDIECSICKTRFKNRAALVCHRRRHRTRWRCVVCLSLFSRAAVAADHAARAHGAPPPAHACHVCGDTHTTLSKLRVHLKNHSERQHCDQCGKTFRDKNSLRVHLYIHTNQKDFACSVCDKKFRFKKALELHSFTHQASELLYCADCDMNFKNRLSFNNHMTYSMKHIHPDKVKYACEFCPRRFSKPSRLQEHRHSLHLHLAPHRCTVLSCTFASASRPALRTHTRMVHRNKRRERNHVCHTCGKAYTTKKILEGHIRSHTGERPFVCTKCPATFSHNAALYNHNKLVHKVPFVRRKKRARPKEVDWTSAADHAEKAANNTTVSHETAVQ